jgi:hypothetical protein
MKWKISGGDLIRYSIVGRKRTRNHPLPFNKENMAERNEHGLRISFSDVEGIGMRYSGS